mgnify:CR=1 FL=1
MAKLNGKKKVNSVNVQVAGNFFGVPKEIRDANKRLSGQGPHSTKDKGDVLKYYSKKGKA